MLHINFKHLGLAVLKEKIFEYLYIFYGLSQGLPVAGPSLFLGPLFQ